MSDESTRQRTTVVKIRPDNKPPTPPKMKPATSVTATTTSNGVTVNVSDPTPSCSQQHYVSSQISVKSLDANEANASMTITECDEPQSLPAIISHKAFKSAHRRMPSTSSVGAMPMAGKRTTYSTESGDPSVLVKRLKRKERIVQNASKEFWDKRFAQMKRPKCRFFSQLYFIFHLATTICLLRYSATNDGNYSVYKETIPYYFGYLLGTSILLLALLRFYSKNGIGDQNTKTENASFVYGSIALGLIQLITIGLDFADCIQSQYMFLSILHFLFVFVLMHFILSQSKCAVKYGFNNIAISHLLATQISLWIMNFTPDYGPCGIRYLDASKSLSMNYSMRQSRSLNTIILNRRNEQLFAATFADMLLPIIHHFQILVSFVLITIWINSNERKPLYLRVTATDTINNPIYSSTMDKSSGKGFFLGLLIISTSIIVLLHGNNDILLTTHIVIQGLSAIASFVGLIIKGKQHKGVHKISMKFFRRIHNEIMLAVALFASYYRGISICLNNVATLQFDMSQLFDAIFLIIQSTFQTLILRSTGRNQDRTRDIFAFLILANFSQWILEVTQIAATVPETGAFSVQVLPDIFVSFSRFYFSTVFFHFWKSK